jgi:mono/diheme cytochrome c family protein
LKDDVAALQSGGKLALTDNPNARAYLDGKYKIGSAPPPPELQVFGPTRPLAGDALKAYELGREVFNRDAHCATCHQPNGQGMKDVYPPLLAKNNPWLTDDERLIKIVLKGLWGPVEVAGQRYDPSKGVPPMPGFGVFLKDDELAAVISYVRQSFGNDLPAITAEQVTKIREQTKGRENFYETEEIMKEHPIPGWEKWGKGAKPVNAFE